MTCWLCGFETTELATNAKAPTCTTNPCHTCIAVANIDEEINQAVTTLRRLLAKRRDLRSKQNNIHGTLRLPTELKSYIFELLVDSQTEGGGISTSRNARVGKPLIYTFICRGWRDIAWSNPRLWSTIHITLGREVLSSETSSSINFLRDWILRSRTLPLTLHIVYKRPLGLSEKESKDVIDALSQCSNRWHSLSFDLSSELICALNHSNIQCHLLRNLRINSRTTWVRDFQPLSNPTMSPERIELCGVTFRSLQISWNRLTSARVETFGVEDLVQLFQHALQMTCCQIVNPYDFGNRPIPPITHQRLKKLSFLNPKVIETFLASLTLPCLQEFCSNEMFVLKYLPALVCRSSCPLTKITFTSVTISGRLFDHSQPLPGVTDLVIESIEGRPDTIKKLLLEDYFPDLRRLTLRIEAFHLLWDECIIPLLLDRKRPRVGTAAKGRHPRILVIDPQCRIDSFDVMLWNSRVGEQLKALQLDICWRGDGFEIFIPED